MTTYANNGLKLSIDFQTIAFGEVYETSGDFINVPPNFLAINLLGNSTHYSHNIPFFRKFKFASNPPAYDDFRRKIRNIVNHLEGYQFLIRKSGDKPDFNVNSNFNSSQLATSWSKQGV